MQIENVSSYGSIYRLTNKINGKMYHGQTILSIKKRWNKYKGLHCKDQPKLYNALKKYGPNNFLFEVIDITAQNQIQLDELEIFYIAKFDSMNNGYNCNPGGFGGKLLSEETKRKISMSQKGLRTGFNNSMYGKHHSEQTKELLSNIGKGRYHSEETKQKMSNSQLGYKNHNFGKKMSDEQKQKISESCKRTKSITSSIS